jgi:DNA-binding CsgD family transcriptional regulator
MMTPRMANWWEDLRSSLGGLESEVEIFRWVERRCTQLGFQYCAYGVRIPSRQSKPPVRIFSTYPETWVERYREANYLAIDPTVTLGSRTREPIVWSDHLFDTTPRLWHEAKAAGLQAGIAQSSWAGHGVFTLLSFARSANEVSAAEMQAIHPYVMLLAESAASAIQDLHEKNGLRKAREMLTRREKEVLRWSADGKTARDISVILCISGNTVNFHIRNAVRKLEVATKAQAVTVSAALGLLE